MRALYLLNVWVHLLAAMVWLGGMLFLGIVGAPVLRAVEPASLRARLFRELGERFRVVGWACIAVLLGTGALNLWFRGLLEVATLGSPSFWGAPYGRALAGKLVGVAVMIVLSAVHDFAHGPHAARLPPDSTEAARARRAAAVLARVNAVVGVLVVLAAVRLAR